MPSDVQIPWDWYVIRASALIGFLLLYLSVFAGTVSCLPGIRRIFLRLGSLNFHCWISLQALVFAAIHGFGLLFHKFIHFSLADILIPLHSSYQPLLVALGTVGFYLMIILVATSYARRYISQKIWRTIHFFNIILYIFAVVHSLYLGTDLKSGPVRQIFIWANGLLVLLLIYNIIYRLWAKIKKREVVCEVPAPNPYEDIRQSDPRAGRSLVEKIGGGEYKIRVTAAPEKGKANEAVIDLLAKYFDVPKSFVSIVGGKSTKTKIIDIETK